jgi:hypothetical protein
MTVSLKDVCGSIAAVTRNRPAISIYMNARELVRCGAIETTGGSGPGRGIRATPEAVAAVLISEMIGATQGWIGIGDKTQAAMHLKADGRSFVDGLAALLAMDPFPKEAWLQISPARLSGVLTYSAAEEEDGFKRELFVGRGKTPPGIVLDANLYVGLKEIAKAMKG